MEKETKSTDSMEKLGLTEKQGFDAKKPLRGETGEASQRPQSKTEKVSGNGRSFQMK